MSITLKEIAMQVGVAPSTVSKVLNGNGQHISDEVQRKIFAVVQEQQYTPNFVAQSLKMKRSKTLGFVLPDICNLAFPQISRGIDDWAAQHGYSVILANTNDNLRQEEEAFRLMTSRMVDGIVFARTLTSTKQDLQFILDSTIPIVLIDRDIDIEKKVGRVFIDTEQATYDMTKYMIDSGCRRLAFISATVGLQYKRYSGFARALSDSGLTLDRQLVAGGAYDIATGYDGAGAITAQNSVDGFVCGNDLIAIGVIRALSEKGIHVPDQIRVAGFDDALVAEVASPSITTVRQPFYQIGEEAAKMLIEHIEDRVPLHAKELAYQLMVRQSA